MEKKTILVIGENEINKGKPYVSFERFVKYAERLARKGALELKVINYAQLLTGEVPTIGSSKILVVFFFPYQYWNRHIETYQDGRIYGGKKFGQEFKIFFREVKQAINRCCAGKRIEYLNPPDACYLDRDKQKTKELLSKGAVPTPRTFRVFSFSGIQRLLNQDINLYVKPRFGAMGKGISFIDKQNLISNFLFRKGVIISRPSDFNWRFARIKDREDFLNKLLKRKFICEEAIEPATFKKRRFDFRIYVMFGNVVYKYVKSTQGKSCVTNWSQGGKIDKRKIILKTLPEEKMVQLEKMAKKAARALGLNFAGIDIIFSKDLKNAYVLEGNAFPGYEKGFDLMKCLLNHVVK